MQETKTELQDHTGDYNRRKSVKFLKSITRRLTNDYPKNEAKNGEQNMGRTWESYGCEFQALTWSLNLDFLSVFNRPCRGLKLTASKPPLRISLFDWQSLFQ